MILNSLNEAQLLAVKAPLGHQLILAGAGSGKTRVLTHRIAWLIDHEHISPSEILAVTFTNKAAAEIRSRLENMLNTSIRTMWIGTFHSVSHRFLRLHWQAAGLPQHFQIIDSDDQQRLIRRLILAMNLDDTRFPAKEAQWFINGEKENGREPHQVELKDLHTKTLVRIYEAYQENCQRSGLIDFADLLHKTCKILQTNAELRAYYQSRFRGLLVDEFQDTNTIQYAWLKLFAGDKGSIMIVGDDDQSIYGWRGAKIENIHRFVQDFPSATTIRLEQNYRSSANILNAANALIAKNNGRLGKNLWTDGEQGEPITIYAGFNETDEAFYIANRIRDLRLNHHNLREIAILYRSNAQSRMLEETLMRYNIPYRVYGGLRYFDRAEIKDALAYLRLIQQSSDDAAFERVVNFPTRGIGDKTIVSIREHAKAENVTLWDAAVDLIAKNHFTERAANAMQAFMQLILSLRENTLNMKLDEQVDYVLKHSGLLIHFRKEKGEKGLTRVENLEELINAAHLFTEEGEFHDDMPPLAAFLSYAALESGAEQADVYEDCIQLMTLHSAKGLEFPVVFLAGCEEGLFPHYLCIDDPKALEEERRLCYVGITRAMKKLYMTYAEERFLHGKQTHNRASRFLKEIPTEFIDAVRFQTKVSKPFASQTSYQPQAKGKFSVGQDVTHKIFGEGTVLECEGDGEHMKVKVRFKTVGTKILIASFLE